MMRDLPRTQASLLAQTGRVLDVNRQIMFANLPTVWEQVNLSINNTCMHLNQLSPPFKKKRMNSLCAPLTQTPYKVSNCLPFYQSFHFDDQPTCHSRFSIQPLLVSLEPEPQLPFHFQGFDIRSRVKGDLMGSMSHLQKQQNNPFDINVQIPSLGEYTPFSNITNPKSTDASIGGSIKLTESNQSSFLRGLQDSISRTDSRKKTLSESVFIDLQALNNCQLSNYSKIQLWQDGQSNFVLKNSLVYSEFIQLQTSQINSTQNYFFEGAATLMAEQDLIGQLILALQGIQGQVLVLDYEHMAWSVRVDANFVLTYYFKESVLSYTRQILEMASIRCRMDIALMHIKAKEPKREIYNKLSQVYFNVILCMEAILMSYLQRPITLLEFSMQLHPVRTELRLLMGLLIRQDCQSLPFYDFNRQYLLSQTQIFHNVSSKLALNDFCEEKEKVLVKMIGFECYKAILSSVNIFLHYNRQEWEMSDNEHFYLDLFFDKKEYINSMMDKLNTIYQDDLQIYNVCKEKHDMELIVDYSLLRTYEHKWRNLFRSKLGNLKAIATRIQNNRQRKIQEVIDRKTMQITEMKIKLMQRLELSSRLKAESKEKQRLAIQQLQKEIGMKIEAQKLLKLIEIEQQRGFLLDSQLRQKDFLLGKKYEMLNEHPELIGQVGAHLEATSVSSGDQRGHSFQAQHPVLGTAPQLIIGQAAATNTLNIQPVNKQIYPEQNSLRRTKSMNQESLLKKKFSLKSPPSLMEVQQIHYNELELETLPLVLSEIKIEVPIKTSMAVCVDSVVKGQLSILNQAYRTILYHKYRIDWVFEFLHKFVLTANGHPVTELLDLAVDMHSIINISYLKDYFSDESIREEISDIEPVFYRADGNPMVGSLNLIQNTSEKSLEIMIGLQFRGLPEILKPIFSYIHMSKYMEIFAFVVRLRHCCQLIHSQWKSLQACDREMYKSRGNKPDMSFLKWLLDISNKIRHFFSTFQNYFYFYVVEKQYRAVETCLRSHQIDNLKEVHNKFLERVCLRGFIQVQHQFASRFKRTFMLVREFHNIVGSFCSDDIASYVKVDIEHRLQKISRQFTELHLILQKAMS